MWYTFEGLIDGQLGILKLAELYFGTFWLYEHISDDNCPLIKVFKNHL